jgi:hypothetical protein
MTSAPFRLLFFHGIFQVLANVFGAQSKDIGGSIRSPRQNEHIQTITILGKRAFQMGVSNHT